MQGITYLCDELARAQRNAATMLEDIERLSGENEQLRREKEVLERALTAKQREKLGLD